MAPRRAKNTNRQGANFELRIMADLTRHGYVAHRSSGSHGAVDVVAVGNKTSLWVQAKISRPLIPLKERRAVLDLVGLVGGTAVPLTASRTPGGVAYRLLTGVGPKDWLPWEPEPLRTALCVRAGCWHEMGWHADTGCWAGDRAQCPCRLFQLGSLTS